MIPEENSPDRGNFGSKNILFLTHNYIRRKGDFAGVFLHLLATKLTKLGFEVQVVVPHDAGAAEFEEIDGIKIHRFRYGTDDEETLAYRGNMHRQMLANPFKIFRLRKFMNAAYGKASEVIEKEGIGIVSVHWVVPNGRVGCKLKKRFGDKIRLFLHSHGTDVRLLNKFYFLYLFFKSAIGAAERWTVVSNYLKRLILERDIYIADKIDVIPLPNDEQLFYPVEGITEDPSLIVSVSRLTVQKRLDILIRAINILKYELPGLRMENYGSGPEKEKLISIVKSYNLEGRIRILAPVPQEKLREIYNKAAIVILNSIDEGFGLSLTEAMLCRRPVIGTDSGGITDIIDDNQTGLLVAEDNPEELARAIRRLITDSSFRNKLAESGYQKAIRQFSSGATALRFAELFGEPAD